MDSAKGVVVVGAGIGGMVLANALSRLGIAVELVELAESPKAVGAGITLGANAMRVLHDLGLGEAVAERGMSLTAGAITDGSGRVLSSANLDDIELRYGKTIAITRAALHEALSETLRSGAGGPVHTHFGTTVASVVEAPSGVEVQLESGTRFNARAVIGADGIHSRVRKLVFGEISPVYSGYTCWRFAGRVAGGVERLVEMWGAGQRVGLVPLAGKEEVYAFLVDNAPQGTPQDRERRRASYVRERFSSFGGDVPRMLDALGDDNSELLHHDIEEIVLKSWVRGRVALMGDAAHAMTPNLGQGAAMAIEDAIVLAQELSNHASAEAGLSAYEARRRPRVLDIQTRSRNLGKVAQWQSKVAVWFRNWALRNAPQSATRKTIERVVAYVP